MLRHSLEGPLFVISVRMLIIYQILIHARVRHVITMENAHEHHQRPSLARVLLTTADMTARAVRILYSTCMLLQNIEITTLIVPTIPEESFN